MKYLIVALVTLTFSQAYGADVAPQKLEELAWSKAWLALLHYDGKTKQSGLESYVDDEKFFSSPNGHVDPVAELQATIDVLIAEPGSAMSLPSKKALYFRSTA